MINVRWVILISLFCLIVSGSSFAQEPTEKEYELLDAAEKGQSKKVLKLLNEKINPNVRDFYGMGPLHYAAQNNHIHRNAELGKHRSFISAVGIISVLPTSIAKLSRKIVN